MTRFWSALVILLVLALAGCGSAATKTYEFTPPPSPGGRLCEIQCSEAQDYCRESCNLANRQCVQDVQTQALADYDAYVRSQFDNREAVDLRPRDFERMTPCDNGKKQCNDNCGGTYRACYQNCGGTVDTLSSCQFLCF